MVFLKIPNVPKGTVFTEQVTYDDFTDDVESEVWLNIFKQRDLELVTHKTCTLMQSMEMTLQQNLCAI